MEASKPNRYRPWQLAAVAAWTMLWLSTSSAIGAVTTDRTGVAPTTTVSVPALATQQLDQLPAQQITKFWDELRQEYGGYLPDVSGPSIVRDVLDSGGLNWRGVLHGTFRYFFDTLFDNASLLGGILILAVLAAVLESLQSGFEQRAVSEVAYAIVFLVLLGIAVGSFTEVVGVARHAIQMMNDFMFASIPVMTALLAASGSVTTAAFFQPMVVVAVQVVSNVVFLFVFPLIFFAAILDIVSILSPRYRLTRLAGLLRNGGVALLGISLSAFLGVSAIFGVGRGVSDGVALRAAKFTVSTFVPVVGKAVADAAETITSASMLVKNAVGVTGLIIVAAIALFPALKILAITLMYSGGSALLQPLGDTPVVDCLGAIGKSLLFVFASLVAVAMMFFLYLCILLASANLAVVLG